MHVSLTSSLPNFRSHPREALPVSPRSAVTAVPTFSLGTTQPKPAACLCLLPGIYAKHPSSFPASVVFTPLVECIRLHFNSLPSIPLSLSYNATGTCLPQCRRQARRRNVAHPVLSAVPRRPLNQPLPRPQPRSLLLPSRLGRSVQRSSPRPQLLVLSRRPPRNL